jgi:hypothetical protein
LSRCLFYSKYSSDSSCYNLSSLAWCNRFQLCHFACSIVVKSSFEILQLQTIRWNNLCEILQLDHFSRLKPQNLNRFCFVFLFSKKFNLSSTHRILNIDSVQEILTNFCHLIIKFPVSLLTLCYEFFLLPLFPSITRQNVNNFSDGTLFNVNSSDLSVFIFKEKRPVSNVGINAHVYDFLGILYSLSSVCCHLDSDFRQFRTELNNIRIRFWKAFYFKLKIRFLFPSIICCFQISPSLLLLFIYLLNWRAFVVIFGIYLPTYSYGL